MVGPGAASASCPLVDFSMSMPPVGWPKYQLRSSELTVEPPALPVAVPRFVYWQAAAVPLPVQVMDSPAARVVFGQETATPLSSVTLTSVSVTLPVFLTTYCQVTALPTATEAPGA